MDDGDHDQDDEAPGLGAVAYGMIDPTASRTTDQPGGLPVTTSFTLTIDCADADQMMEFWTTALGYKSKDPPEGFDDWCSYFRSIGVPEGELHGNCTAYLVDPEGVAPQIFLREVPEGNVPEVRVEVRALDRNGVS